MTTTMPDKCPRCGSPYKERWGGSDRFRCGSFIRVSDGRFRDSENCVRLQLEAACAELDRLRQRYETLRAAVEGVAERIGEAADGTYKAWQNDARDYLQGRAHAMEHAERMVRRILSDACPYCSAPMEDDPGRYPSGDVDMAWTCGTWRMIDGVTFRSDGCGAREVADDV